MPNDNDEVDPPPHDIPDLDMTAAFNDGERDTNVKRMDRLQNGVPSTDQSSSLL